MRVYFYDGLLSAAPLIEALQMSNACELRFIDAGDGVKRNIEDLDRDVCYREMNVLTNSILALDHCYAWNKKEKHTDIYLWVDELDDYIRIDRLTEREIREAHCIGKMYLAGCFRYEGRLYG